MPETLIHDGPFDIATGRNRKETNWKNKEMLWSELVEKLRTTHRTAETIAEYATSKKTRQDEIKDIGGFVTGYLTGGRRKAANVLHKQVLALDLDYATPNFWLAFTLTYPNAAIVYSTHKHKPDEQRLRLLLMLDRSVRPDEYEAIARRVAGKLGIELFDPTTFQAERLMYWPSTSKDGEYVFEYQDSPFLCADEILATYHDWKDSSAWPVSAKVNSIIQRNITKQGDPLEKPGVVGAFCRTYTIAEAIETYLLDVYDACDIENRYTYKEGSTAAGLIVYDDKYAYSHHGTDPTSGKLCNSFDLVRLHKFGLKDEDAREGTPGNKLPSYTAMLDFTTKDTKVKAVLGSEKMANAMSDFSTLTEAESAWVAEMEVDRYGNYVASVKNFRLILENDPYLKKGIGLNTFSHKMEVLKKMPWDSITEIKIWSDDDWGCLRCYLGEDPYNMARTPKLEDVVSLIKKKNSFHPVTDYLNRLQWDGRQRVDSVFIDYLGAENTEYTKAVTRKALVACVARVFKPGVKFDTVLTLVGKQGTGKSTIIKKLGKDWYSDTFSFNMLHQGKQAFEQIQGVWLVEIGEMVGLKKADVEAAKNFISSGTDIYRPSHGRETVSRKRQCVFFGTTNSEEFLKAANGNRRFWPVDVHTVAPVKSVWKDLNEAEINQIWAEALVLYNAGEPLNLSQELEDQAMKVQEAHEENDERAGLIAKYLDTPIPANWAEMSIVDRRFFLDGGEVLASEDTSLRNVVCVAEIHCEVLGGTRKDMTTQNTKSLHDILRSTAGWEQTKSHRVFEIYGKQRSYERIQNPSRSKALAFTDGRKEVNAVNAINAKKSIAFTP